MYDRALGYGYMEPPLTIRNLTQKVTKTVVIAGKLTRERG